MNFSLERFEFLCYGRQHEAAAQELVQLLAILEVSCCAPFPNYLLLGLVVRLDVDRVIQHFLGQSAALCVAFVAHGRPRSCE